MPWLDKVSAFIWEFSLSCGNSSEKVTMKSHELPSVTINQTFVTNEANRDIREQSDPLLKLTPDEERRLEQFGRSFKKPLSACEARWLIAKIALAHLDIVRRQLRADALYAHAEGLNVNRYWDSLIAMPYKSRRRK